MEAVGLSGGDRLQQAYRSFGGGVEAYDELEAQGAVVLSVRHDGGRRRRRALVPGAARPHRRDRSGPSACGSANGRFADGDLRGAAEAITEAQRILAGAESGGIIHLVSAILVVVILVAAAVLFLRRRASYTARP